MFTGKMKRRLAMTFTTWRIMLTRIPGKPSIAFSLLGLEAEMNLLGPDDVCPDAQLVHKNGGAQGSAKIDHELVTGPSRKGQRTNAELEESDDEESDQRPVRKTRNVSPYSASNIKACQIFHAIFKFLIAESTTLSLSDIFTESLSFNSSEVHCRTYSSEVHFNIFLLLFIYFFGLAKKFFPPVHILA